MRQESHLSHLSHLSQMNDHRLQPWNGILHVMKTCDGHVAILHPHTHTIMGNNMHSSASQSKQQAHYLFIVFRHRQPAAEVTSCERQEVKTHGQEVQLPPPSFDELLLSLLLLVLNTPHLLHSFRPMERAMCSTTRSQQAAPTFSRLSQHGSVFIQVPIKQQMLINI